MGPAQPPRHRCGKKAMQFSARRDPGSKRNARRDYWSITIILSRRCDPAVITADPLSLRLRLPRQKYGVIRGLDPRIHPKAVIPGRASSREPGIQNSARLWIPGLRPRGRIPE
jgi:hypothetical protein